MGLAGPTWTGVLFGAAVLVLFWKGDDAISQSARESLSNWLQGLEGPDTPHSWPDSFIAVFDRIFGENLTRIRALLLCAASSFAGVVVMLFVWGSLRPDDYIAFMHRPFAGIDIIVMVLSMNVAVDYFSLQETRLILGRIRKSKSTTATVVWLILDLFITGVIFFLGAASIVLSDWLGWEIVPLGMKLMIDPSLNWFLRLLTDSWLLIPDGETGFAFGVLLYTTYLTSLWIWAYIAARAVVRGLALSGSTVRFLQWALPIRSKPIRSIGEVAAILCCVGYWVFAWIVGADPVVAS